MSLIWADGFDHYGDSPNDGRDAMLSGAWAQLDAGNGTAPYITDEVARTGTYALGFGYNSLSVGRVIARRVLGASHNVIGIGSGFYFPALPTVNQVYGFSLRNNANQAIVTMTVESDGAIGLYTGSTATLLASSDPVIQTSAWQHIETKIVIDDVVGSVEIRVDGNTVLNITDINIGTLGATQVVFGMPYTHNSSPNFVYYIDDVIAWNDNGTHNNDFMGQQRVYTLMPNGNEAAQDWTVSGAASGYQAINEIPPNGTTTHIEGAEVGDVSEFTFDDMPPETETIEAVYVPVMARIPAAGIGAIEVSLLSGASVAAGGDITLTTAYAYWGSVFEVDPATSVAWTRDGLNATRVRVEKTV